MLLFMELIPFLIANSCIFGEISMPVNVNPSFIKIQSIFPVPDPYSRTLLPGLNFKIISFYD